MRLVRFTAPIPGRKLLVALLVIFVAAVVPGVFVPTLLCRSADPKLDDLGAVGTFTLTDERGVSLRLAVYRRRGALESAEARRAVFDGIVSVTFSARDAIGDIIARHEAERLRLRVAPAEPCPLCGIPYVLIRSPAACDICGAAPCLSPGFCDACRHADADRRKVRR